MSIEDQLWQKMQLKADLLDYLGWLETLRTPEEALGAQFLCIASDGTTCWGHTFQEAVRVAMEHDKELYDATAGIKMPAP